MTRENKDISGKDDTNENMEKASSELDNMSDVVDSWLDNLDSRALHSFENYVAAEFKKATGFPYTRITGEVFLLAREHAFRTLFKKDKKVTDYEKLLRKMSKDTITNEVISALNNTDYSSKSGRMTSATAIMQEASKSTRKILGSRGVLNMELKSSTKPDKEETKIYSKKFYRDNSALLSENNERSVPATKNIEKFIKRQFKENTGEPYSKRALKVYMDEIRNSRNGQERM